MLAARAIAQTTIEVKEPSRRGDIYDRSGTVVLATTVERDRLVASVKDLTVAQRRQTADELIAMLQLDPEGAAGAARQVRERQGVHRPGPRDHAGPRRPDPGRRRREAPLRHHAGARADARLPADRRRTRLDAGGASARLREPRGRRAVRHRAGLPGHPRRHAARRPRRPRRDGPRAPRHRVDHRPRRPGPGHPHDHRCRPAARRRAGAARGLGRRQGQERVGGRHGPVHRRGLRRGDLPLVRRQPVPPGRDRRAGAVHRPGRLQRLRARLRLQDDDRGRRARAQDRHAPDEDQRHRDAQASTRAARRSTTPTARDGLDVVRGRRRLLPQRRGRQGRARPRQDHPPVVGDPLRHVAQARLRGQDRHRRRERGVGHRPRPGHHAVGADRPRQRVVRPGRRGDPDPARDRVRGADERRDARPAARGQGRRQPRDRARVARPGHRTRRCRASSSSS